MAPNTLLATCDAAASAVSLAAAAAGFAAIRRRRIAAHRRWMLVAAGGSAAFLVLFVARFATYGFAGGDALYTALSYAHEPVAVINVPLVAVALVLGLRRVDRVHREVAPLAFWIWVYVLVTGLALYVVRYVLD